MTTQIGSTPSINTNSTKLNTAPGVGCVDGAKAMSGKENPGMTKPQRVGEQKGASLNAGRKS